MVRSTTTNVRTILGNNYDGSTDLTAVLASASVLVDQVVACAAKKKISLSDDQLLQMETNLAAHLYARQDPFYQSRSTGGASGSFQGQTGMGLDATHYGQTAKMFDTSGCLSAIGKGNQVLQSLWLGKPPSEQSNNYGD